jgi:hypothetical protein
MLRALTLGLVFGAMAGPGVQPFAGESVAGRITFPRPQGMSIAVLEGGRLSLRLGFDGRCAGGGLGELWMAFVPAKETLVVRRGVFAGKVTGTSRGIGGDAGRTARFTWSVSGRFTDHQVARVTVSGSAIVRAGGKAVSRCEIAKPASARLA